ncbi:hypothetical protein NGM37_34510, partial [Streptomyces sp. TRM76130]|nr:hypothetical protein [Streptomyces sp. TRM76130]
MCVGCLVPPGGAAAGHAALLDARRSTLGVSGCQLSSAQLNEAQLSEARPCLFGVERVAPWVRPG